MWYRARFGSEGLEPRALEEVFRISVWGLGFRVRGVGF